MKFCITINDKQYELPDNIVKELETNPSKEITINVFNKFDNSKEVASTLFSDNLDAEIVVKKLPSEVNADDVILSDEAIEDIRALKRGGSAKNERLTELYQEHLDSKLEEKAPSEAEILSSNPDVEEIDKVDGNEVSYQTSLIEAEKVSNQKISYSDVSEQDYDNEKKPKNVKFLFKDDIVVNPTFIFNNLPAKERSNARFLGIRHDELKILLSKGVKDFILGQDKKNYWNKDRTNDYSLIEVPVTFSSEKYQIEGIDYLYSEIIKLSQYGSYIHRQTILYDNYVGAKSKDLHNKIVQLNLFSDTYALNEPKTYQSIPQDLVKEIKFAGTKDEIYGKSQIGEIFNGVHLRKGNAAIITPHGKISVFFPTQMESHFATIFENISQLVKNGENKDDIKNAYNTLVAHASQKETKKNADKNANAFYKDYINYNSKIEADLFLTIRYNNEKHVFYFTKSGKIKISSQFPMLNSKSKYISPADLGKFLFEQIKIEKPSGRPFTPKIEYESENEKLINGTIPNTTFPNILKGVTLPKNNLIFTNKDAITIADTIAFFAYTPVKFDGNKPVVYRSKYNAVDKIENKTKKESTFMTESFLHDLIKSSRNRIYDALDSDIWAVNDIQNNIKKELIQLEVEIKAYEREYELAKKEKEKIEYEIKYIFDEISYYVKKTIENRATKTEQAAIVQQQNKAVEPQKEEKKIVKYEDPFLEVDEKYMEETLNEKAHHSSQYLNKIAEKINDYIFELHEQTVKIINSEGDFIDSHWYWSSSTPIELQNIIKRFIMEWDLATERSRAEFSANEDGSTIYDKIVKNGFIIDGETHQKLGKIINGKPVYMSLIDILFPKNFTDYTKKYLEEAKGDIEYELNTTLPNKFEDLDFSHLLFENEADKNSKINLAKIYYEELEKLNLKDNKQNTLLLKAEESKNVEIKKDDVFDNSPSESEDVEELFRTINNNQIGEKITKQQFEKLNKIFPSLENREFQLISDAINTSYWGRVSEKGFYLKESATTGTLYHEAWHEFSQWYLTKKEKNNLYTQTKKILGQELSNRDSEEFLAEEFSKYKLGLPIHYKLERYFNRTNNVFYRILNFIKSLFGKKDIASEFKKLSLVLDEKIRLDNFSEQNIMFNELDKAIEITNADGTTTELFSALAFSKIVEFNDSKIFEFIFKEYKQNINNSENKNFTYFRKDILTHPTLLLSKNFRDNNFKGLRDILKASIIANAAKASSWQKYVDNFDLVFNEYIKVTNLPFKNSQGLQLDENGNIADDIDVKEDRDTPSLLQGNETTLTQDLDGEIKVILQSIGKVKRGVKFDRATYRKLWYDNVGDINEYYEKIQYAKIPQRYASADITNKLFAMIANTTTYTDMIAKMESLAYDNPEFWEILDKLPTPLEVANNAPNAVHIAAKFEAAKRYKLKFYTATINVTKTKSKDFKPTKNNLPPLPGEQEEVEVDENDYDNKNISASTTFYEGARNNQKALELDMVNGYVPYRGKFIIEFPVIKNDDSGKKVMDRDAGVNKFKTESFEYNSLAEAMPDIKNFYLKADSAAIDVISFKTEIKNVVTAEYYQKNIENFSSTQKSLMAETSSIGSKVLMGKLLGFDYDETAYSDKQFGDKHKKIFDTYIKSQIIKDQLESNTHFSNETVTRKLDVEQDKDYLNKDIKIVYTDGFKSKQERNFNYHSYNNFIATLSKDVPFQAANHSMFYMGREFFHTFNIASKYSKVSFTNTIIDAEGKLRNTLNLYNSLFHYLDAINDLSLNSIDEIVKKYPFAANLSLFLEPTSMLYDNPYLKYVFDKDGKRKNARQLVIENLGGFQVEFNKDKVDDNATSSLDEIDKVLQNVAMHGQFERFTRPGDKAIELGFPAMHNGEPDFYKEMTGFWLNELGYVLHKSIENGKINYNKIDLIAFNSLTESTKNVLKELTQKNPNLLLSENPVLEIIQALRKYSEEDTRYNKELQFIRKNIDDFAQQDHDEQIAKYKRLGIENIVDSLLRSRNASTLDYIKRKHVNYHTQMYLVYGYHGQYQNVFKRNSNWTSTGKGVSYDKNLVSGVNKKNKELSHSLITQLNFAIKSHNFNGKTFNSIQDIAKYLQATKFADVLYLKESKSGRYLTNEEVIDKTKEYIASLQLTHKSIFDKLEYDENNPTYKVQIIKKKGNSNADLNYVKESPSYQDIQDSFEYAKQLNKEAGILSDAELKPETYKLNNSADAQGWVSFSFYRDFSNFIGNWSADEEYLYNGLTLGIIGKTYKGRPVTSFFTAKKPQYAGNVPIMKDGKLVPNNGFYQDQAFDKMSFMPYIPIVFEGTKFEHIGRTMAMNDIAYTLTEDGRKIGEEQTTKIIESRDNGYQKGDALIGYRYFAGLKEQVNIAKEDHDTAVFAKQVIQIIQGFNTNSKGEDIPELKKLSDDYNMYLKKLTTKLREDLYADIGFDPIEKTINVDMFKKVIDKELADNPNTMTIMEALEVKNGEFIRNLEATTARQAVVNIIYAIYNRRLISMHVNGDMLVQVSSQFITDNDLLFYKLGTINGVEQTLPATGKFALRGQWVKLLDWKDDNGKKIGNRERLNEILKGIKTKIQQSAYTYERTPKGLIAKKSNIVFTDFELNFMKATQVSAVRIPTQGFNSMEVLQIEEFLDSKMGGMVIVPSEITTKAGSDFDIDKLVFMFPELFEQYANIDDLPSRTKRLAELKEEIESIKIEKKNLRELLKVEQSRTGDVTKKFIDSKNSFFSFYNSYIASQTELNAEYSQLMAKKNTVNNAEYQKISSRLDKIKNLQKENKDSLNFYLDNLLYRYNELINSGAIVSLKDNNIKDGQTKFIDKVLSGVNSQYQWVLESNAKYHLFNATIINNQSEVANNYTDRLSDLTELSTEYNGLLESTEKKLYHNSLSETIKSMMLHPLRYSELIYPNGTDIIGSGSIDDLDMAINKIELMKLINQGVLSVQPNYDAFGMTNFNQVKEAAIKYRQNILSATGQAASKLGVEESKTKGGIQTKKTVGIGALQVTMVNLLSNLGVNLKRELGNPKVLKDGSELPSGKYLPLYYFTKNFVDKNVTDTEMIFNANTDNQLAVFFNKETGVIETKKQGTYLRRTAAEQILNPILDALNDNNPISQIGINKQSLATIEVMVSYLGVSPEIAYYLLNQPAVQKHLMYSAQNKSELAKTFNGEVDAKLSVLGFKPNYNTQSLLNSQNNLITEDGIVEMFTNMGKNYDTMSLENKINQEKHLHAWLQFEEISEQYRKLQEATNWATNKQTNYMDSVHKVRQFEEVKRENYFTNIDVIKESVVGNFAIQDIVIDTLKDLFPLTTTEHFTNIAMNLVNGDSNFTKIQGREREKFFRLYTNDFFSFVLQNSNEPFLRPLLWGLINTFGRLESIKSFKLNDIEDAYKNIYTELKLEISKLKQTSSNHFIQNISFNEVGTTFNLEVKSKRNDIDEKDAISEAMIQFKAVNPDLANKLFLFGLLQDGLNKSTIGWANMIPPSLYYDLIKPMFDKALQISDTSKIMNHYTALFIKNNVKQISKKDYLHTVYKNITTLPNVINPIHNHTRFKDYGIQSYQNRLEYYGIKESIYNVAEASRAIASVEYNLSYNAMLIISNIKPTTQRLFTEYKDNQGFFVDKEKLAQDTNSINVVSDYKENTRDSHFGNPFTITESLRNSKGMYVTDSLAKASELYLDWILFNTNNIEIPRREWILSKLNSGELKNKKILDVQNKHTQKNITGHGDILYYLANNWDSLKSQVDKKSAVVKSKEEANVLTEFNTHTQQNKLEEKTRIEKEQNVKKIYKEIPVLQNKIIVLPESEENNFNKIAQAQNAINPFALNTNFHFGNPLPTMGNPNQKQNAFDYIEWLLYGIDNIEAERRAWIITVLDSGKLKGKNIIDTVQATKATHADTLHYLINNWKNIKPKTNNTNQQTIEISDKTYSRNEIEKMPTTMFLFTDNNDRTSNNDAKESNIDLNSWYYKKYARTTDKKIVYPTQTSAIMRGLNNAYPISTMIAKGVQWDSSNLELFQKNIDDEIEQIKKDMGKFDKLVIGNFRIGQGGRFAKLPIAHQKYLDNALLNIGIDNLSEKPKIITNLPKEKQNIQGEEISSYSENLAFALTNPTHTSPRGYIWSRNWSDSQKKWREYLSDGITYNGVKYADVEQAYKQNKTKFFKGTEANPDYTDLYNFMYELIIIKLKTYPKLVEGITVKGGIEYLKKSTHQPTAGSSKWETNGENMFLKLLGKAYLDVLSGSNNNSQIKPIVSVDNALLNIGINNSSDKPKTVNNLPNENQNLLPKNLFTVKPIVSVDNKAITKAKYATKYIGFGNPNTKSSTYNYSVDAGVYANTGNYTENDVVFLSVSGNRSSDTMRLLNLEKTKEKVLKAIKGNAIILKDTEIYIASNTYNVGEKEMSQFLKDNNYVYEEVLLDNTAIGMWRPLTIEEAESSLKDNAEIC